MQKETFPSIKVSIGMNGERAYVVIDGSPEDIRKLAKLCEESADIGRVWVSHPAPAFIMPEEIAEFDQPAEAQA